MKFGGVLMLIAFFFTISPSTSFKKIPRHHGRVRGSISSSTATTSTTTSPSNPLGSCEGWWCGAGKECEIGSDGLAKCGCASKCPEAAGKDSDSISLPVCGTDGHWYENHCQLHRASCVAGDPTLGIDHSVSCPKTKRKWKGQGKGKWKGAWGGRNRKGGQQATTATTTNTPTKHWGKTSAPQGSFSKISQGAPALAPDYPGGGLNNKPPYSSSKEGDEDETEQDTAQEDSDEEELDEELSEEEEEEVEVEVEVDKPKPKKTKGQSNRDGCSPQEYEILKDNLLLYNHERMIGGVRNFKAAMESAAGAGDGPEAGKDYLLSLMFSHFDKNNNGALEYEELARVELEEEGFPRKACRLVSLLKYDDSDHNGRLNINEFYTAFNKLYSVSVISLDKALETTSITASVGDNVEIKCDVSGSPPMPIVWKRYGVDLSTLNEEGALRVLPDGTLYLNKIQLMHAGNYSCQALRNSQVIQTHVLSVQTLPIVHVMPHIVWEKPGAEISLECRVSGEPFPVVSWLKNDEPLPLDMSEKYSITGDGIRLTLKDIYFSDTGAYMCKSENSAGKRLDIGSLVVIDQQTPSTVQLNESEFFVLHGKGISAYDPSTCRLQNQILGTDIIPGTQEYVCGESSSSPCEWGAGLRISSTYVYISQPKLDRVLVVSTNQMVVVDVIPTDRYPVELHYVPHLDQVWVECWRNGELPGAARTPQKTLQVIREGKEKRKHSTVHPEPIDSHFDLVERLFLPKVPDPQFRYGYVSHRNGRGLYKMDLAALRYTKNVDLTPYNCVPKEMQFSTLYGFVIVECFEPVTNRPMGNLVLDALTDSVVYYKRDRVGSPYLSPDSRKLVTVSHGEDGTTTLLLQLVRENGLEFSFDVKTSLNISDVAFFPSQRSHAYDLYASSVDKDDVLFVDLESGKVEMVSGVSSSVGESLWSSPIRPISSQGIFSKYLATPSADSVFILNGHSHTVNCQIGGLSKPRLVVWL